MDLNSLCIEPRLRTSWEAVDLGFKLARQWYWQLLVIWFLPFFLVCCCATLIFHDDLILAYFAVWWFKPIYDRAPLFFISRALFDAAPTVADVFKQSRTVFAFDWFAAITWRRFSFTRSYDLPITLLERLTGDSRTKRLRVLHHKGSGVAVALGLVCLIFESCVAWGCVTLVALLIPQQVDLNIVNGITAGSTNFEWSVLVLYFMAAALIAPLYVCAGFMLYINRRVELEAWDVEIQFRKLAQKVSHSTQSEGILKPDSASGNSARPLLLALAVPLLGLILSVQPGAKLHAETTSDEPITSPVTTPQEAKQQIQSVLEGEAFNQQQVVKKWRLKSSSADETSLWDKFLEWLKDLFKTDDKQDDKDIELDGFKWLATTIEILLWLGFALVVVWIIYRYRHNLKNLLLNTRLPQPETNTTAPEVLFGLKVTKESLPTNVVEEVLRLNQAQAFRQAVSLLYRASLTQLIQQKGLDFNDSLTENECVAKVQHLNEPATAQFTQQLTRLWQRIAYGHLDPKPEQIDSLCEDYQKVFAP